MSNETELLKEDPHLVKKIMGTMRKKLDSCLRRDGAHVKGIVKHWAFKKQAFVILFCCN